MQGLKIHNQPCQCQDGCNLEYSSVEFSLNLRLEVQQTVFREQFLWEGVNLKCRTVSKNNEIYHSSTWPRWFVEYCWSVSSGKSGKVFIFPHASCMLDQQPHARTVPLHPFTLSCKLPIALQYASLTLPTWKFSMGIHPAWRSDCGHVQAAQWRLRRVTCGCQYQRKSSAKWWCLGFSGISEDQHEHHTSKGT